MTDEWIWANSWEDDWDAEPLVSDAEALAAIRADEAAWAEHLRKLAIAEGRVEEP